MSRPIKSNISIPVDGQSLEGIIRLPPKATLLVVFVHGSGSSRLSPRNEFVADSLYQTGIGSLLFDLLTEAEDKTYATRFDIELLVRRLAQTLTWLRAQENTKHLPFGLFGASTGAAAALIVAAQSPQEVSAVVSRGGRTDLAGDSLSQVTVPTLFIIGGADDEVLALNRDSYNQLAGVKQLSIIPGATHLFEEPGALEQVSQLAIAWFTEHTPSPQESRLKEISLPNSENT
ncbi:MAG: alpha/beta family hydrolase [Patescibacteria group bacterium]|jgi:dienelactone hydrolase